MSGPMGLVYPVPGDTFNTWGTVLNTLLGLVENHDHTSGKGSQVPSAGVGINADLAFASFAATAVKALCFTEVATSAVTSYADALFVNSSDHNLYFRNVSGTNVQLTNGNTINISLVGGIGGDYSLVGALLSYVDSSKDYLLQQEGSPKPWAGLEVGDIKLYQKAASISNAVTLKSPASLAAAYTLTMLTALPGSTLPLQVSSTGQVAASASIGSTITIPDYHLTTPRNRNVPACAAYSSLSAVTGTAGVKAWNLTGSGQVTFPIPYEDGDTISAYSVLVEKVTNASVTLTAGLYAKSTTGTGDTLVGSGSSTSADAPLVISFGETGLNTTGAGNVYYVVVSSSASSGGSDLVFSISATYTR